MKKMFDLYGKTALVTGSSRGIGKGIATTLAAYGAKIFVHASRPADVLDKTVNEICDNGGKAVGISANLASLDEIARLVAEIKDIDILVLNASMQSYQTIEEFTVEEFESQYMVNMASSFELIKAFLPGMKVRNWGRLLSIGSVNQFKPSPRLAIYSSTKSALANLMLNCARQYSEYGITANNIAPGVILTDRNSDALQDDRYKAKLLDMIPSKRFGNVDDCVGLALLLCSNAGGYITGEDISVTGGMHL